MFELIQHSLSELLHHQPLQTLFVFLLHVGIPISFGYLLSEKHDFHKLRSFQSRSEASLPLWFELRWVEQLLGFREDRENKVSRFGHEGSLRKSWRETMEVNVAFGTWAMVWSLELVFTNHYSDSAFPVATNILSFIGSLTSCVLFVFFSAYIARRNIRPIYVKPLCRFDRFTRRNQYRIQRRAIALMSHAIALSSASVPITLIVNGN